MESKDYVLCHDFGYGRETETEIKKLKLRNINDLIVYTNEILETQIIGDYNDQIKVIENAFIKIAYEKVI